MHWFAFHILVSLEEARLSGFAFFFVPVGYFFVDIIEVIHAEEGATCRTSGWTGFTVKLTVVIVGVCM